MTDQHQAEDEQAAQINALRQALAAQHSPLPWSWWTSCSFVRLSSDVTRCDGDVLHGEVHKDGQTSVAVTFADRDLIASAVNAAPVMLARVDALEHQVHDLNWALGTPGYETMKDPADQARSDEANARVVAYIDAMKARQERHQSVTGGADPLDLIEQLRASMQPGPERIEAAAKALASAFAYPWEHMPEQGRENMRKHVRAVLMAVGVGGGQ